MYPVLQIQAGIRAFPLSILPVVLRPQKQMTDGVGEERGRVEIRVEEGGEKAD